MPTKSVTHRQNPTLPDPASEAGQDSSAPAEPAPSESTDPNLDGTASKFHIVGIGASAGGLAAFEQFFSAIPAGTNPGMAYVLVQHLDPTHSSMLAELIQRYTHLEVSEVQNGVKVMPNRIYIIPPGYYMACQNGTLQLSEPSVPRGQRLPIDFFFCSLAQDQRERAVAIVLSGAGSDGALGVRAVNSECGTVFAQTPESTEFDSMPLSAISTGIVDFQLLPSEMPAQLAAFTSHAFGKRPTTGSHVPSFSENALRKIFVQLRSQTGHDFSQYKTSTIHRRIQRRIAVHQIGSIENYAKFLHQNPAEVDALFQDMLIGVTSFFRDPETFRELEEKIIPELLADKPAGSLIRFWSAGCSTGEEAYSLAILLQEHIDTLKRNYVVQIFATDIDSKSIATARQGVYPASIAANMSPQRLERFFTFEPDTNTYSIHKSLRNLLIFSEQDLIKDPPFSKLDLICCRNLLIYFNKGLQTGLFPLFHYALNPGGTLFLGTSETVGGFEHLFTLLDRKLKLYQRKQTDITLPRSRGNTVLQFQASASVDVRQPATKITLPSKPPFRELTEQTLLQQVTPVGVLVNGLGDILYLHGRTGMYLEPAPGEPGINNILKMAREGLLPKLNLGLHSAAMTGPVVRHRDIMVKTNGHFTAVDLSIFPVTAYPASPESPLYLVVLEEGADAALMTSPENAGVVASAKNRDASAHVEARLEAMRQELRAKDGFLQAINEELATSNEKLKSANEEMQSVNEELHSTNEELETSQEELQSVNKELATVNAELETKVADLSQANNDMNNLLAGNGIGTIFVNLQKRILRFTPAATRIINLIGTDIGRPMGHISTNMVGYDRMVSDIQSVLDTLIPKEVDVKTADGNCYTMRILPYRTLDNRIEGVVVSFVDVTEINHTRETLRKANDNLRLAVVVRDARDAITVQDLDGHIIAWNPGATKLYGWTEAEALRLNARDRIPKDQQLFSLAKLVQLSESKILEPYQTQRITKSGVLVDITIVSTALMNEADQMYAVATTERASESKMTQ